MIYIDVPQEIKKVLSEKQKNEILGFFLLFRDFEFIFGSPFSKNKGSTAAYCQSPNYLNLNQKYGIIIRPT
jgi:hypothetical protein